MKKVCSLSVNELTVSEFMKLIENLFIQYSSKNEPIGIGLKKDDLDDEYLTVREVADILKLTTTSVHRLKDSGKLHHTKFGGSIRFTKSDVFNFGQAKGGKRNYQRCLN